MGLMYQDPEEDKYVFEKEPLVDCKKRVHICKAICCKLPFALSKQDVKEGIIRWEFARPYLIAHTEDDYCVHLDRITYNCTVRDYRPLPCRGFGCQDNEKWQVWKDFDMMELNPEFTQKIEDSENIYQDHEVK